MSAQVVTNFEEALNRLVSEHDKLIKLIKGYTTQSPLDEFLPEDSPEYQLIKYQEK